MQQGHVFAKGPSNWACRYRLGGRDSKRMQQSGFPTEQAAQQALDRGRHEQGLAATPTLSELVDIYLAQHDTEPETIDKLRWLLTKATAAFGTMPISELQPAEIAAWRMTIPYGHRFEATQSLRQTLARAVKWGMINGNPAFRLTRSCPYMVTVAHRELRQGYASTKAGPARVAGSNRESRSPLSSTRRTTSRPVDARLTRISPTDKITGTAFVPGGGRGVCRPPPVARAVWSISEARSATAPATARRGEASAAPSSPRNAGLVAVDERSPSENEGGSAPAVARRIRVAHAARVPRDGRAACRPRLPPIMATPSAFDRPRARTPSANRRTQSCGSKRGRWGSTTPSLAT
jgi:hypothetical protein